MPHGLDLKLMARRLTRFTYLRHCSCLIEHVKSRASLTCPAGRCNLQVVGCRLAGWQTSSFRARKGTIAHAQLFSSRQQNQITWRKDISLSVNNLNFSCWSTQFLRFRFPCFQQHDAVTDQDFDLHLRAYLIRQLEFREGKFMTSNYYGTIK